MRQLSLEEIGEAAGVAEQADAVGQAGVVGQVAKALTAEQELAASRRQGSMLLTAAAGSGKTSVLVERYVRAVIDDGIEPARVLAITFTERAAWELKERVRSRLQSLGRRELARDTEAASIGTIHGFCARLLRADPLAADLSPDFQILEEATASRMRIAAFRNALRATSSHATPAEQDAIAAYTPDRLQAIVLSVHAELRSRGEEAPSLPAPPAGAPKDALAAHALIARLLERFAVAYEARKSAHGVVDFDDLELRALRMLEQEPEVRRRWTERFDMLMVDEFQDTNPRQLALLLALERENLFTVGDEWQSIYGFRHADVEIFRRRAADLLSSEASLALTHNFRSRPAILDAVNAAFTSRFGERFNLLQPAREPSPGAMPAVEVLLTDARGWDEEPLREAISRGLPPAPVWRQAEARLLARRLARLIDEGDARPDEVAVLLRSTTDLAVYEAALRAEQVPTSSMSAELWEASEVKDVLCWLRALANPLDEVALHGVLAGPRVGLPADSLWLLSVAAQAQGGGRGLWRSICEAEVDLPAADAARLVRFRERFTQQRMQAGGRSLTALVREAWSDRPAAPPAPASVRTLARLAGDFEALEGRDLRGFVDHLQHLAQTRAAVGAQAPEVDREAVRLMSIHAAKGLEFPVVCIADLGRSANGRETPHLLVDKDRVGLRVARLDGSAPEPAFDYEQLASERALAEEQEEDRILYVAMTRAEEMLLLSGAASFERWPAQTRGGPPIAWLAPALVDDLHERLARAGEGGLSVIAARSSDAGTTRPACMLSTPSSLGSTLTGERPAERSGPLSRECAPDREIPADVVRRGLADAAPDALADAMQGRFADAVGGTAEGGVQAAIEQTSLDVLSYTTLSQLERCGYRYYLERVLGLEEIDPAHAAKRAWGRAPQRRGSPDGRLGGQIAHRLMEGYDFTRCTGPRVQDALAVAAGIGAHIDEAEAVRIVAMLGGLGETALGRRLARARGVVAEQPFCFLLGGERGSILGSFDAIATERDGTRLVVDYKTDAVTAQEDLEGLVGRDYELQRLIYALAALRDGARAVEVVHWFLQRPQEPVAARFSADELAALEARLADRVGAARRRGFGVSESPHRRLCATCPGNGSLCSWPQSATMREQELGQVVSDG